MTELDRLAIATLRGLALDMPRSADSGHSGTALACAPLGWLLYSRLLKHSPEHPDWPDRDRFVLSNGHACVLLYGLLHLTGYALSLEDLKQFRQPGSKTPGHPESWVTPGVDFSTGPLGQGLAAAVGMAIAECMLAARFGRRVDHYTYVLASDGDLMEGITSEASSLAGHLGLGKLIVFYDSNQVTIDGPLELCFSEDVTLRYQAYGWHVLEADGEDLAGLEKAVGLAQRDRRPSLIRVRTTIGFPSPGMQGRPEAHSPPFSSAEIRATKEVLGLDPDQSFEIAAALAELAVEQRRVGQDLYRHWQPWASYDRLPEAGPHFEQPIATRVASGQVLQWLAEVCPNLVGGSADLAGSTNTYLTGHGDFSRTNRSGRNLRFGVREQAMAAITNGLVAHGGLRAFCSTYFAFSDYMKPAIRLAALAGLPSLFVFSHDSLALGEDGPTHQPVEQLAALRALPNCQVIRPADGNETTQAWSQALAHQTGPSVLVLSRQTLPGLGVAPQLARGGYVVSEASSQPAVCLLASGSEVHLCLEARQALEQAGVPTQVVSLPCWELFFAQPQSYRDQVLGPPLRIAVEAASRLGWHELVGGRGAVLSLERFGASGRGEELMRDYGFTAEAVVALAQSLYQLD
ncbi:MAG: transketolase family protein [Vulcanimicrobiota bacterium]